MSHDTNTAHSNAEGVTKYDLMTVRSVRGLEARTIAKWERDGWELVSQEVGKLQTQITMRRPKSPVPWRVLAIIGGVLAVVAIVIVIGNSVSGNELPQPGASPSSSAAQDEPAGTLEPTLEASPPADEEILTDENNADLDALLSGPAEGPTVEQFAQTYEGRSIEFNGSVGAMAPHGDFGTRYDILIVSGDYSAIQSSGGPNFQFRDVNTTSDLHYDGENVPDTIGVGTNVRVVARVSAFEPSTGLLLLEPVSTQFR